MAEFGSIFEYGASTTVFCWISIAFIAVYGLAAIWNAREDIPAAAAQPA